ncbi:outer membrane beta-barrel protein [Fangia hongkongensis]|uniref:outer membrane beta-barrel protein n=1 Tax=Fangia hongkongensis TaxID=270495 RepID=UPI0003829858|nr:outer membrane beta-barrel protein [Fangia hongkongensis]MBK2125232.1 outer membrane beta-barrel protein [Fangia hongkongensis]
MRKIIATSIIATALASGSAFAAGAQTGVVLGGNIGYGYATNGWTKDDADLSGSKNGNLAGGLFIGYDFALNKMLSVGVELGGQYAYQLVKESDGDKLNAWSVPLFATAKFYIPHAMGLNIFGKFGYAYNRLTTSGNYVATGLSGNDIDGKNLWRPVAAGGLGFQVQQFNIFAQYQYNWLPVYGKNGGYGTISGGVSYTLPM